MTSSHRRFRVLLLLALALCGLSACGHPPADQTLGSSAGGEPAEPAEPGAHHVAMMGHDDDAGLRPLDAPLEVTHEEGVEPRAVEDLGPPGPAILITSSLKGYIEPCGCTLDVLLGGIDRVSGYVRSQQALLPGSLVIDTGSMLFEDETLRERDVPQAMRKARLLLQGHRAMGTASTTPGRYDLSLGVDTYRAMMAEVGMPVTVANLTDAQGKPLGEPWRVLELPRGNNIPSLRVGLIGVIDPGSVADLGAELVASPPLEAARAALAALAAAESPDVVVLVAQGKAAFARELGQALEGVDFVLVGHEPDKTDEVVSLGAGGAHLIEPYSQGRHVGVLKLYPAGSARAAYQNARLGSEEELARLDRRIAYLDSALDQAGPALASNESEFVKQKRAELKALEAQRLEMSSQSVTVPEDAPSFAWFSVAMEPGYPLDVALFERKQQYTAGLESLYAELALEVEPVAPGQASYVGGEACVDCHEDAHDVWESTPHMLGYKTLVAKGKQFDPDCVSCHVTGYGQPGGSIMGRLDGLLGVQCEACHGPGSIHVADPGGEGPGQVWLEVPASICLSCHDPENSPRFDYEKYLPHVLGEGHGAR